MANDEHVHGPDCEHDDEGVELDIVELEDENGETEEFAILEELDFEGGRIAVLTPLADLEALEAEGVSLDEADLDLHFFEVEEDTFKPLEDDDKFERLAQFMEARSKEAEA